jgi:4'-phosphopantetheinyl transferase
MRIPLTDVPAIAPHLENTTLHVWQLDYDPRHGRAPLLALLGAYLQRPVEILELVEGEHGRPVLPRAVAGDLDFNWSHSGQRAVVVLGRSVVPGVDVERRRARPRASEIAQRYFHPDEAGWLASLSADVQGDAFLSLWTAKEAVLKALGRGLAFGLHRLRIGLTSHVPELLWLEGDDARAWQLHALALDDEHVAALAWRGPPRRIQYWGLAEAT